jgi:adenosylcobinamide-phosphate synthase
MTNIIITVLAYIIDRIFGEFPIKHPVIAIGELISFFEEKFYKDSIFRGVLLVLFVLTIVSFLSISLYIYLTLLPTVLCIVFSSIIASMFIAHKMLRDSVKEIATAKNKKEKIAMLVSRDTQNMDSSDIYKAAIETYAENLSDGVIAPLFYLLIFNLPGVIIYKAINTMDSMVGYRNKKYENFGKAAAILDDIANYIPARITALIIMICSRKKDILSFHKYAKKHESPNAGYPISAMALSLDIALGGDTYYFSKLKHKPYFGDGRKTITKKDLYKALRVL